MLHEQFQHQNVANSIEHERLELKNAANTLETTGSNSKLLEAPPKLYKIFGKWKVPTSSPKILYRQLKRQLQLQNAANSKENGQKKRSAKMHKTETSEIPKTIPDLVITLVSKLGEPAGKRRPGCTTPLPKRLPSNGVKCPKHVSNIFSKLFKHINMSWTSVSCSKLQGTPVVSYQVEPGIRVMCPQRCQCLGRQLWDQGAVLSVLSVLVSQRIFTMKARRTVLFTIQLFENAIMAWWSGIKSCFGVAKFVSYLALPTASQFDRAHWFKYDANQNDESWIVIILCILCICFKLLHLSQAEAPDDSEMIQREHGLCFFFFYGTMLHHAALRKWRGFSRPKTVRPLCHWPRPSQRARHWQCWSSPSVNYG